jgi:hypothetical protein
MIVSLCAFAQRNTSQIRKLQDQKGSGDLSHFGQRHSPAQGHGMDRSWGAKRTLGKMTLSAKCRHERTSA